MTAADRQARSRAKRAAAGCSRVSVTLSPEAAKALERLTRRSEETVAATIARAVIELDERARTVSGRAIGAAKPDPFGAEFAAGIVPDPSKGAIETSYTASEGLQPSAVWIEEFAGMPDPLEALRGMPSPVDPRKPR